MNYDDDINELKLSAFEKNGLQVYRNYKNSFHKHEIKLFIEECDRGIYENLKDLEATQTRLLRNPKDIADVFRPYYGNSVSNEIQRLLTEHLVIGKDLIVALKNKNQENS